MEENFTRTAKFSVGRFDSVAEARARACAAYLLRNTRA
ncbi:MAG: hypothetical protein LBR31_01660 [Desulfovibrio sp.]|nr:hypothetical protein [Desulfovibrio sp.]